MVKLSPELKTKFNSLQDKLLDIVDESKATEFTLLRQLGETSETLNSLNELTEIAQQASDFYSQLSRLILRITEVQPSLTPDMLKLLIDKLTTIQNRIPALERSIEEIKTRLEIMMTDSRVMPDPDKLKKTLDRSRHRRKELELLQLELEELIVSLEMESRKQRKEQLQQYFKTV